MVDDTLILPRQRFHRFCNFLRKLNYKLAPDCSVESDVQALKDQIHHLLGKVINRAFDTIIAGARFLGQTLRNLLTHFHVFADCDAFLNLVVL